MTTLFRSLRAPLSLAAAVICLLPKSSAQTLLPETVFDIGLLHAQAKPYNFTGRIFDFNLFAQGSGTLIRRHTILTAAHVVYDPTAGFATAITFTRGLYQRFFQSQDRIIAVNVLSGYQALATGETESVAASQRDLGYALVQDPSIDEDFGLVLPIAEPDPDPNPLTDGSGRFVLGYPGPDTNSGSAQTTVFNGRTLAYTVPPTPYQDIGGGVYENGDYVAIPGMSGGPIYSVQPLVTLTNGTLVTGAETQQIVAETINGTSLLTTGEQFEGVRAVDAEANQFLVSAEYSGGLIIGGIISQNPITPGSITSAPVTTATVARGSTVIFYTAPVFGVGLRGTSTPTKAAPPATTANTIARYSEIGLTSDLSGVIPVGAPGTTPVPLVSITQLQNNKFQVAFSNQIRSGTITTLQLTESGVNFPSAAPATGSSVSLAPSILRVTVK